VGFTPRPFYPRYQFDRRLDGPQSMSRRCGEENNLDPAGNRTRSPSLYRLSYPCFLHSTYRTSSSTWLRKPICCISSLNRLRLVVLKCQNVRAGEYGNVAWILFDRSELFLRAKIILKFGAIVPLCLLVCAVPYPATFFRSILAT
jgi:hypothetical protein